MKARTILLAPRKIITITLKPLLLINLLNINCMAQNFLAPPDPMSVLSGTFWHAHRSIPASPVIKFPDSLYKFDRNKNMTLTTLKIINKDKSLHEYPYIYESDYKKIITIYFEHINPIKYEYQQGNSDSAKLEFRVPRLPGQPVNSRNEPKLILRRNSRIK